MDSKKSSKRIVIAVAAALIVVLLLDAWQVFRLTSELTLSSGRYHLESISGELESTVGEAEKLAMKVGIASIPYLTDQTELERFIRERKAQTLEQENGCYNVYMAGTGWAIIPDFDMPEDYVATERDWYKGAKKANGDPYVTAPYVDAMTGEICYTVSVMLSDGDTVVGLDYTMDTIQSHIVQMYENGSQLALIVTGDGVIAGCSDEKLIGKKLSEVLPEYSSIFSLAKTKQTFVTNKIKSDVLYENLFAAPSGIGWYLIVSESDWNLYKDSYLQLIVTTSIVLLLLLVIVIFFMWSVRREQAAQEEVREKDRQIERIKAEITGPLHTLLETEREGNSGASADLEHAEESVKARRAARQVLETLQETKAVSEEPEKKKKKSRRKGKTALQMDSQFRFKIMLLMALVILISFVSNFWISLKWGDEKLRNDVNTYDYTLSQWVGQQKSILDMFCSMISTNPEMMDDYDEMIARLDSITQQYPEISVTYMTNPNRTPTVYMNNGWLPPDGWQVEERQWYKDTMESESGWTISAPYFDEQTGLYCVTFAERVYDAKTGEYLGTFGIDFFLDKLIAILGGSYTNKGYAFLADTNGVIINHPYGSYQMTESNSVNVSELSYGRVKADGRSSIIIRDYDGVYRVLIARRNSLSNFVIYEAVNFLSVYSTLVISELLILILLITCAVMINRLLVGLMKWQESMNARMQEAADSAIAAGKAKSRFLAQMSHEIRTPINAVLGMNEMILRESKERKIKDYAQDIRIAGKTLLTLINSILDFSKIEEGKMEIIPVEYDTASFINNLVVSVSERAKAKGLKLVVDIDENLPSRLYGDDVRLSQVVVNILTNAVKYTEKGEVRFTILGGKRENGKIELKVSVADTGIGIRQEDLPKLFESFERLDEVRNHSIEGTGLGMSIVTKLLGMMDSKLNVESEFGKGSTFSFCVLQEIRSEKPIGNYTERLEAISDTVGKEVLLAEGARVLVVDDNEMNLKVAQNLMKLFGFVPDLAGSGAEAIEYVRRNAYHIIFMDHMMPGMDGIETLAELKKENLITDDSVVIALTANAVNGAKEQYLEAGFTSYLSKPIDVSKLEEKLMEYLPSEICHYRGEEEDATSEVVCSPAEGVKETFGVVCSPAEGGMDADPIEKLRALGYDVDAGLLYVAGDRAFYLELVKDFEGSAQKNAQAIRQYCEEKEIHEYQIRVHALKSTARQIGATALSDLALKQENAAKAGDTDSIGRDTDALLALLEKTQQDLREALGEEDAQELPDSAEQCAAEDSDQGLADGTGRGASSCKSLKAEEAIAILKEAAEGIDNFEAERAADILRGLKGASVENIDLDGPICGILDALEDFDNFAAAEQIGSLLSELSDLGGNTE